MIYFKKVYSYYYEPSYEHFDVYITIQDTIQTISRKISRKLYETIGESYKANCIYNIQTKFKKSIIITNFCIIYLPNFVYDDNISLSLINELDRGYKMLKCHEEIHASNHIKCYNEIIKTLRNTIKTKRTISKSHAIKLINNITTKWIDYDTSFDDKSKHGCIYNKDINEKCILPKWLC